MYNSCCPGHARHSGMALSVSEEGIRVAVLSLVLSSTHRFSVIPLIGCFFVFLVTKLGSYQPVLVIRVSFFGFSPRPMLVLHSAFGLVLLCCSPKGLLLCYFHQRVMGM